MSIKKIPDNYVQIGRLGKTYQLKGGLRFYSDLKEKLIFDLEHVFIDGLGETDIRELRQVGPDSVVYLTRALSVEAAKPLVNRLVYAEASSLTETLVHDCIGFPVFLEGQPWGNVVDIQEGLQDVLIIDVKSRDILIPLEAPYVRIAKDAVYLEDVPEGLIDLNQ
jgi:16S rRNA processing protein RimM